MKKSFNLLPCLRKFLFPLSIFLLMVYGGVQVVVWTHGHSLISSSKKNQGVARFSFSTSEKHCLICDFLFKKIPEQHEANLVFCLETSWSLIFSWTCLIQLSSSFLLQLKKLGRAPPLFSNLT